MGKIDTCTKDYVRDNTIFADIFNQFIYKGEQKITPEQLRSVDTTEISVPYGIAGSCEPTQKYRDHLKILTVKEDQAAVYMLIGVENQSKINYAMPVKCMVYDALNRTDFREVILFCKYMEDKKKLAEIIKKESGYKNMERKAIRVIEEIANVRIKVEEKEGKGNMCEGLQGIIDDATEEVRMKMSLLIQNLRKDGREGDIDKMCLDKDYYDQLLKEYKIK